MAWIGVPPSKTTGLLAIVGLPYSTTSTPPQHHTTPPAHPHRQVCTLADLDAYLAQQHRVSCYNDLCMGPLLAHELVIANFQPPPHVVEIPQVCARTACMHLI